MDFEKLLSKVGRLTPEQKVSCFVSGLQDSIRTEVQAVHSKALSEAIGLARLYEAKLLTQQKTPMMSKQ